MGIFNYKGPRYRIRIFDNFQYLMSAEVPDKGQRYFTVTVHAKYLGLGDKTKLAFMLAHDAKPKIFDGTIFEVDFDIRDSVPLADLLDLDPDLVYEINKSYKEIKSQRDAEEGTIDAEYSIHRDPPEVRSPEDVIEFLKKTSPVNKDEPEPDRAIESIVNGIKTAGSVIDTVYKLKTTKDEEHTKTVQKAVDLITRYPKLLYWLPARLNIEPEIHALVSQSRIHRVGVMPSYYTAQTGALISEKTLTRPSERKGWEQTVLILGVMGLVTVLVIGSIYFITK
jgi:hypothetical protein